MNSKMTEKEARARVGERLSREVRSPDIGDPAWEAIKEALGLEFAPEPYVLPKKLRRDRDMNTRFDSEGDDGELFYVSLTRENRAILLDAMHDRYNAYPGLRKTADSLHALVGARLQAIGADSRLRVAYEALGDELVKGPKP